MAILFYLPTIYWVYNKHSCMKNNRRKLKNTVHHTTIEVFVFVVQ